MMKPVKKPAASVKLMVRSADYDYLSTLAVLNGVSIPAALAQILRGVRKNGLSIEFAAKETTPPPVKPVTIKYESADVREARQRNQAEYDRQYGHFDKPKPVLLTIKEQFLAAQPPDMVEYFMEQPQEEQQALLNKWCEGAQDLDVEDED